ncbi:MAG TPA: methyltransferase domain-containing protein [Acidimicrobiales bacterium]|nr:methyltransferase domain-containing protein [Acidimicrobiales bacterium]
MLRQFEAHLTALEFDPDLASASMSRLAGTNVEVVHGDATAMNLPSGRFTGAAWFHMLHHIPTTGAQDSVYAEPRPGQVLVAADGIANEATSQFHVDDIYNPNQSRRPSRPTESGRVHLHDIGVYVIGGICTAVSGE